MTSPPPSAGPLIVFRRTNQADLDGIVLNIPLNATELFSGTHQMLVRFVLPEWRTGPAQQEVGLPGGAGFQGTQRLRWGQARGEQ